MPNKTIGDKLHIKYHDQHLPASPEKNLIYAIIYRGLADLIMYYLYLYHGKSYGAHSFAAIRTSVWWIKNRYTPFCAYDCCMHTGLSWEKLEEYTKQITEQKRNKEFLMNELKSFRV